MARLSTKASNDGLCEPLSTVGDSSAYLRSLSVEFMESLNTRNFNSNAFKHVSPAFEVRQEADHQSHASKSRADGLNHMRAFLAANPDYHTEVLDTSVHIDSVAGLASVWILRTCTGLLGGPRKENVCQLTWQWEASDWFCIAYCAIRSFPLFTNEALNGGGM